MSDKVLNHLPFTATEDSMLADKSNYEWAEG